MISFFKSFFSDQRISNRHFFALGFISILAAAPIYYFWIHFFVFSILLHKLFLIEDRRTLLKNAFSFGFGFALSHFYWISFSLLVRSKLLYFAFPFAFIIIPAYFALYYVLQFYVVHFLKERFKLGKIAFYFLFALSWVGFEFIRSNILLLVSLTGFPWGLLGYDIFFSDHLAQLASYVPVYALSLVILLVTSLPFLLISFNRTKIVLFFIFLLILAWIGHSLAKLNLLKHEAKRELGLTYRIIHPNISEHHGFDQDKLINDLIDLKELSFSEDHVDLVIWPEGSISYLVDINEPNLDLFSFLREGLAEDTKMIIGIPRDKQGKGFYNSLAVLSYDNQIEGYYDKRYLVPFGEFMPYSAILDILPLVSDKGSFVRGNGEFLVETDQFSFTGLICYDALFPNIADDDESDFIINISNDIWFIQELFGFNISLAPFQHLDMLRMRAIESGKPILRSTNRGISAVITPTGKVEQYLSYEKKGVISGSL